MEKETTTLLR
jgi:hypothetical protein